VRPQHLRHTDAVLILCIVLPSCEMIHNKSTVRHAHAVTSIKQPPVLKGQIFLILS